MQSVSISEHMRLEEDLILDLLKVNHVKKLIIYELLTHRSQQCAYFCASHMGIIHVVPMTTHGVGPQGLVLLSNHHCRAVQWIHHTVKGVTSHINSSLSNHCFSVNIFHVVC